MKAICAIPNCRKVAPVDEAFCSDHRDTVYAKEVIDIANWEEREKAKFCATCGVCAFDTLTGVTYVNPGEPEVCEGCALLAMERADLDALARDQSVD